MRKILIFILFYFLFTKQVISADNNIYGIHLAQPDMQDIRAAAGLVNSNGGKWGYVTLVIQENDRNRQKWQGIFDHLRELNLIPIVRIATSAQGENWRRPETKDAASWADFLNSLNWVVKDRYVVLFNEPNHGSEWGGETDEKSFAKVCLEFAKNLKKKNKDFFVMLAGFDASAPSWPPGMEDEAVFLQRIIDETPDLFEIIDGLASHSYPNPGFSGSPYDSGRGTIKTYEWELELLKSYGVKKELPVFITETGWKLGTEDKVGQNFLTAYRIWENDPQIMAVTPFILNYQSPPFLEFSWKKQGDNGFYNHYFLIQNTAKVTGRPNQIEKGKIAFDLPVNLVSRSKYDFKINLVNLGQAIWDNSEGYEIVMVEEDPVEDNETDSRLEFLVEDIKTVKPYQEKTVEFSFKTKDMIGKKKMKFKLLKNGKPLIESKTWEYSILPLPNLEIKLSYFPFFNANGNDFEIQIFDSEERLVYKKKGITVSKGLGTVENIQNIALDELYRLVVLGSGSLPRQSYYVFTKGANPVKFKPLLPVDFNRDGRFDWLDIQKIFRR